jgi:hypothetical protein
MSRAGSCRLNLFLREPSGVLHGLLNVSAFQIRIAREDLVKRRPVRYLSDNDGYGDPHAADAGPSTHDPEKM